jgi:hypothetical protein
MDFKRNSKKNKLMVFERKVLRKIFDPKKERDGTWSIKTNNELDKLIRHKNIINYIKAQRLIWFGHLHRMPEERMANKVYKWKPMLRRPLGRPKNRWKDDIRNDMKKLKIKIQSIQCMYLYNIHTYIYICMYIQTVNTTTSDQSNMQDTATCFGLVNGPSSGLSQNL